MAYNSTILVPVPKEKIAYKDPNKDGSKYVYYLTECYRDKKGNPTNRRKLIGKIDKKTGLLIPNKNYYQFFNDTEVKIIPNSIINYGGSYLVNHILKELKIDHYLVESFGEDLALKIMTIATYMFVDSSIMFYLDEYCSSNFINTEKPVTSQSASQIFDKIDHDQTMRFYKKWVKHIAANEYIAYDVTSISSYSCCQDDVEFGYNRDKEKLPQFNIGMYFGETSGLPIFYTKYPGSILDKSNLKYMMEYNKELGIENANFVMDKDFYTRNNIIYMKNNNLPFLICVSNKYLTSAKKIKNHIDSIERYDNFIKKCNTYGILDETSSYGVKTNTFIYYDSNKAEIEKKNLYRKIEKYVFELSQIKVLTKTQARFYNRYLDINYNQEDKTFTFAKNGNKIDELAKKQGFFILISTLKNKDISYAIKTYRRKDCVEKTFDNLKNSIDMKRLHTHKDSTTDGKLFVSFISLIIKTYVENKLQDYLLENNSSIEKIIRELQKIKLVTLNKKTIMAPLTAKQKKILLPFDINEDTIINSLKYK